MEKVLIYDIDKMTYILYKIEGVDYETELNDKGRVIFTLKNYEDVNEICSCWDRIKNGTMSESIDLSKYIYLKSLIIDTIRSIKRR